MSWERKEEFHVLGEEEGRERGDDVGQEQDHQEREERESQKLGRQQVANPLGAPEVQQHPEDDAEDEGPEEQPDEAQHAPLEPAALLGLAPAQLGSDLRAQEPENPRARVRDAVHTNRRASVRRGTPADRPQPRPCHRLP